MKKNSKTHAIVKYKGFFQAQFRPEQYQWPTQSWQHFTFEKDLVTAANGGDELSWLELSWPRDEKPSNHDAKVWQIFL